MVKPLEILSFWFGTIEESNSYLEERRRLWFGGSAETDALIRRRFEDDVERGAAGAFNQWEENPLHCLALIILLDQFPLNIYRGQARAFEISSLALPLALRAVNDEKFDQRFHPLQRMFFYLPLEHSESLPHQEQASRLMSALTAQTASPVLKKWFENTEWWAREHKKVIEQFGRFPGRNQALGRLSSPAEREYLNNGGSPF